MTLFKNVNKEKLKILLENGFHIDKPRQYEELRYKGICTVILFNSGKLLAQGDDESLEKVKQLFKKERIAEEVKNEFKQTYGMVIGSDESLKGDTFGGIVVAGVKVDDKQRELLKTMSIKDSKKLNDNQILQLAPEIKKIVEYHIISLNPEEYNNEIANGSSTELLNKLHREVKNKLGSGKHIVDQYPGCNVGDIRETKADSNYIEVATASILAREGAIKQLAKLSLKLGMKVPKGSSNVKSALEFLKKSKKVPEEFVKLHFGNVKMFFRE